MREREEAMARAEAICQAQEEREIQGKSASGPFFESLSFLLSRVEHEHPPRGGRELPARGRHGCRQRGFPKEREGESEGGGAGGEGSARCGGCAGRGSCCWVDPAWIKRWKEAVACGVPPGRMPAGVACKECSGRKQKCFLPELSKKQAALKPVSKRKREEGEQAGGNKEDELWASGSRAKVGSSGEGGVEAPKKKQKVEVVVPSRLKEKGAPQAAQEWDSGLDIVTALVAINNSVAALVRAIMESNDYLWVISEYVDQLAWGGESVCGVKRNVKKKETNLSSPGLRRK